MHTSQGPQCDQLAERKRAYPAIIVSVTATTVTATVTPVMLLSFTKERMIEECDLKVKFEASASEPGGAGEFVHVYGGQGWPRTPDLS